uniref:Uncharacterized protein n=1 Tax=Hemiselmis tepida TaxID=464990 RepID=A0A7S0YIR1_9CRYP
MRKHSARKMGGGGANDVLAMEEKLAQLKIQMELERQRRSELMNKSGVRGTFWRSGQEGALRGPGVREAVKAKKKAPGVRPTSSDASREETPTEEAEAEGGYLQHGQPGQQAAPASHGLYDEEDRPPSPSSPAPEEEPPAGGVVRMVGLPKNAQEGAKGAPVPAVAPMAMECQTEALPMREWSVSRPGSAKPSTYMQKLLAERKKSGKMTPR